MNVYPAHYVGPMEIKRKKGFRMTAGAVVMVFVLGMFAGYIVGLWHQIAQKAQRIEDEKILAAGCYEE